jgi:hypothetical protein
MAEFLRLGFRGVNNRLDLFDCAARNASEGTDLVAGLAFGPTSGSFLNRSARHLVLIADLLSLGSSLLVP